MARQEREREDLLREAKALVERIEIVVTDQDPPVVIGFRSNGAASLYFGGDPVYHFNSTCELRRAFIDGLQFKAVNGRLVSLSRKRTQHEVELVRHELTGTEQAQALANIRSRLDSLRRAIASQGFEVIGQIPEGADLIGRVSQWLSQLGGITIARSPGVS